jgi:DNA modification methylase
MLLDNKIYNCDCLEAMKEIDDKSIDLIVCDLPYGCLNKKNLTHKYRGLYYHIKCIMILVCI